MEIIGVELPGRGSRIAEPLLPDLDTLAFEAAEAIADTGDTRFALFGHSMGALLAFEVARRLRGRGGPAPRHLFVSGCRAPHCERSRRPVAMMSTAEFISMLRDLNGTPDSVLGDPELMDLVLPVLKSDFTAVDRWNYRPDRALNIPVTAFGGRSDPHVSVDAVREWQHHTRSEFQCRLFSGDHFFIHASEGMLLDFMIRELEVQACV
jgi:surfactin synthase thioesterase subunit